MMLVCQEPEIMELVTVPQIVQNLVVQPLDLVLRASAYVVFVSFFNHYVKGWDGRNPNTLFSDKFDKI